MKIMVWTLRTRPDQKSRGIEMEDDEIVKQLRQEANELLYDEKLKELLIRAADIIETNLVYSDVLESKSRLDAISKHPDTPDWIRQVCTKQYISAAKR